MMSNPRSIENGGSSKEDRELVELSSPTHFDVVLSRKLGGFPCNDRMLPNTTTQTNVPWTVIWHSPTGFEWGYGGSGPADLALNILNAFVPPGTDGHKPVPCFQNTASRTAVALHQQFKSEFLARMPDEGGVISKETILGWIEDRQQ